MNNKSYTVVDCVDRNQRDPDHYRIASRAKVRKLKVGDTVQLVFELKERRPGVPAGERMWVRITRRMQNDFVGALDSEPILIDDLKEGSLVCFCHRDVLNVWDESTAAKRELAAARMHGNVRRVHVGCNDPKK